MSALSAHLFASRWFGGKGRSGTLVGTERLGILGAGEPHVVLEIATVAYDDAPEEPEFYQLPLALYADRQPGLDGALIGKWDDPDFGPRYVYDAVRDPAAAQTLLHEFSEETATGVRFQRVGDKPLNVTGTPSLFAGEQSNSSIAFGSSVLLKLFRRLAHGENPDIAIHRELTAASCPNVAGLLGWIESDTAQHPGLGGTLQLGMLQEFVPDAQDGWALAVQSAGRTAADFAPLADELGAAIAAVHRDLGASFEPATIEAGTVAADMRARLAEAARSVPALVPYVSGLNATYAAAAGLGTIPCQRVHGDLHLGQTLHTASGWKVVDFEGEPTKSLEERMRV